MKKCDFQNRLAIAGLIAFLFSMSIFSYSDGDRVEKWDVFEIRLDGPSSGNPYLDVELKAVFHQEDISLSIPGFYDGNGQYKIRFSPDRLGQWTYVTQSNHEDLSNQKGAFVCVSPSARNHGPVKIVNTYYLEFSDGTPFYSVGTTAYQWTSVKQSIQEQTLETLQNSPFNKMRMCVFPKWYDYGNKTEPWAYPFENEKDFSKPNYAFFQNFDRRVRQLCDLGVQADVILFHPYDRWGYAAMGKSNNERYVRFMIARLSAYRNVWWSLANEWDVPSIKEAIDWDGIGQILQNEDPHRRFRGIHNWYDSDDHFFDHSKEWLTHISTQTSSFHFAEKWKNRYKKPLLFDEMRYEGDVKSGWGNMSGQQMASYFWMAGLSGGYGTHGDTFQNKADTETEVRWWAKGGLLVGSSPPRIAFFRRWMEKMPLKEMNSTLESNGDPTKRENNVYFLSKEGDIYLAYTADPEIEIRLTLAENKSYRFVLIDTWNMTVTPKGRIPAGAFSYKTANPYMAVCLYVDSDENDRRFRE